MTGDPDHIVDANKLVETDAEALDRITAAAVVKEAARVQAQTAAMLAERRRAADIDAIGAEFGEHAGSMAVAVYHLRAEIEALGRR